MSKVIHNFSVSIWLAALMAVSFAGAAFGFLGIVGGIFGLLLAGAAGFFSLSMAYNKREQKDALKQLSDGVAIAGMVLFLLTIFVGGLISALIVLLFFLHLALNLAFREHRQTGFGLLINFIALMVGATHTFSAGYLLFMLGFCVCSCFYMALLFVDKQRYELLADDEDIESASFSNSADLQKVTTADIDELNYVGEWRATDKMMMALAISLIAGSIYLLTPHFAAGNLGRMPIEGFGKYDNGNLEQQILPEGSDIDDSFYDDAIAKDNQQSNSGTAQSNGDNNDDNNDAQDELDMEKLDELAKSGNLDELYDELSKSSKQPQAGGTKTLPMSGSAEEQLDNSIYYYVKSDKPRYMQTHTATYFDGASWHRLQYGWRKLAHDFQDFTLYPDKPNAAIGVTVVKETSNTEILTTDNTVGIRFPSYWVASDYYDQLKTGYPLKKDTSYELMLVDKYDDTTGRMIDSSQASPDKKDLQLPNNLDPRIKKLADKLVAGADSDIKKAEILEQHLRTNYAYTLDTVSNQNNIPLADFLFGSKRGHCEYFATSMAVMLRQQGIPARMISGFVASDHNPVTGFYEVKGTNGHVWVQAYVNGNWTLYEATGAYATPQEAAQAQQQTRNTHEIIKDYLEQVNEQDERLQEVKELSIWDYIQIVLRSFWHGVLMGFAMIVQILKMVLPWLLIVAAVGGASAWFIWNRWQAKAIERADKQGYKELQQLAQTNNTDIKQYIHQHLEIYQAMLARHKLPRPIGQQVEEFAQILCQRQLCSQQQANMLIEISNANFYLTHTSAISQQEIHQLFIQLYEQGL